MDPDLALVLGIVIGALSIPSILSALSDRRAPRASALTILIAGGWSSMLRRTNRRAMRWKRCRISL
ncbi:hypothetical protein ACFQFQ_18870 [Sulfitobacter porphyrae]|uniref:Uncharacterized protein n=1 Tax=Sulfitobacter porphyrae TaxID=1246864 RepID=A0ABW2B7C2_9RHOB